jgi:hypothetical protein
MIYRTRSHVDQFSGLVSGLKAERRQCYIAVGKKYGYSFFTLCEEKSGINGNFPGIQNVGHLIPGEVSRELTKARGFTAFLLLSSTLLTKRPHLFEFPQ